MHSLCRAGGTLPRSLSQPMKINEWLFLPEQTRFGQLQKLRASMPVHRGEKNLTGYEVYEGTFSPNNAPCRSIPSTQRLRLPLACSSHGWKEHKSAAECSCIGIAALQSCGPLVWPISAALKACREYPFYNLHMRPAVHDAWSGP